MRGFRTMKEKKKMIDKFGLKLSKVKSKLEEENKNKNKNKTKTKTKKKRKIRKKTERKDMISYGIIKEESESNSIVRRTKLFLQTYDEDILNIFTLVVGFFILNYTDERITCKRNVNFAENNIFIQYMQDAISGRFGYNVICLQWKAFIQSFCFMLIILSMICQVNKIDTYFTNNKIIDIQPFYRMIIRKIAIGGIISNYSSLAISNFLATSIGYYLTGFFMNCLLYLHNLLDKLNIAIPYDTYMNNARYTLILIPTIRSRKLIDLCFESKNKGD